MCWGGKLWGSCFIFGDSAHFYSHYLYISGIYIISKLTLLSDEDDEDDIIEEEYDEAYEGSEEDDYLDTCGDLPAPQWRTATIPEDSEEVKEMIKVSYGMMQVF